MSSAADALAIVQARMSSTRLPGKVLADVGGEPMLALLLARLRRSRLIGRVVVATSTDALDEPIEELCHELGIDVCRGPREDVLTRFLTAIGDHRDPIVRITGDCPLIDPCLVDAVIERFLSAPGCAYASNVEPRSFPDGLDVEVIDPGALRAIAREQLGAEEREHVTSAIRATPARFSRVSLVAPKDMSALRWTVDEPDDLEFVRTVVQRLGDRRYVADLAEILAAVQAEPSLAGFGGHSRA